MTGRYVLASLTLALLSVGVSGVDASHLGDGKKHRIVYQLDDPGVDKARFVLNNIANHVKGVGGFKNIEALELVVFGPALKEFMRKGLDPEIKHALEALQAQGVVFGDQGLQAVGYVVHGATVVRRRGSDHVADQLRRSDRRTRRPLLRSGTLRSRPCCRPVPGPRGSASF